MKLPKVATAKSIRQGQTVYIPGIDGIAHKVYISRNFGVTQSFSGCYFEEKTRSEMRHVILPKAAGKSVYHCRKSCRRHAKVLRRMFTGR